MIIVPADEVSAFVVGPVEINIQSAKVALPINTTGEIQTAFFTSIDAPTLLTVIKLGLPPKIATVPEVLLMFVIPISQKRIRV